MREEPRATGLLGCATLSAIFVPLVAVAVLFTGSMGGPDDFFGTLAAVLIFGTPVAALHVVVLWLPAYFFATRERDLSWWTAAALGLVCGGLPAFLLSEAEPGITTLFAASGLIGGLSFRATFELSRM